MKALKTSSAGTHQSIKLKNRLPSPNLAASQTVLWSVPRAEKHTLRALAYRNLKGEEEGGAPVTSCPSSPKSSGLEHCDCHLGLSPLEFGTGYRFSGSGFFRIQSIQLCSQSSETLAKPRASRVGSAWQAGVVPAHPEKRGPPSVLQTHTTTRWGYR